LMSMFATDVAYARYHIRCARTTVGLARVTHLNTAEKALNRAKQYRSALLVTPWTDLMHDLAWIELFIEQRLFKRATYLLRLFCATAIKHQSLYHVHLGRMFQEEELFDLRQNAPYAGLRLEPLLSYF